MLLKVLKLVGVPMSDFALGLPTQQGWGAPNEW
jgi:hypothetical protein